MQKFISKEKLTKKKQQEINAQKRRMWNTISPVTRVKPSKKVYDRNKEKRKDDV